MHALAIAVPILLILTALLLLVSEAADYVLLLRGAAAARRYCSAAFTGDDLLKSPMVPAVAVITVPSDASEEARLQVHELLKMRSGDARVFVVLDGPTDQERVSWLREFRMEPVAMASGNEAVRCVYHSRDPIALTVIDRPRGGLAACLNTALQFTEAPVLAIVDQTAEVSEEALLLAMEHFIAGSERKVALCVAGPSRQTSGFAGCVYRVGFLRSWLESSALAAWNAAPPLPGSLTLFDRDTVLRLGGFQGGALEMATRIHKMLRTTGSSERIGFLPVPVVRPRVPRSWAQSRAARARLRSDERRGIAISGLVYYCFRPFAYAALVLLGAAALAMRWMDPDLLISLLGVVLLSRILMTMAAVVLGEYAAPADGRPGDLAALFLTALCFWTN